VSRSRSIGPTEDDWLKCDAEYIGDLESDALTRVKATIPAAIRRKVFHRDSFACVVPGCRATRNLDCHHVVHRKDGGKHTLSCAPDITSSFIGAVS
jgi:hypothetical protein